MVPSIIRGEREEILKVEEMNSKYGKSFFLCKRFNTENVILLLSIFSSSCSAPHLFLSNFKLVKECIYIYSVDNGIKLFVILRLNARFSICIQFGQIWPIRTDRRRPVKKTNRRIDLDEKVKKIFFVSLNDIPSKFGQLGVPEKNMTYFSTNRLILVV